MKIKYEQPTVYPQSYKSILGQRPLWDWRQDKLLWVDIYENKIIETDQNNAKESYYIITEGVTNILLQDNENYLMSSHDSIFSLHSSITKIELLSKINFENSGNRINDADIDLNGNVWISTMDTNQESETGKIVDHGINLDPIYFDNSYLVSNSPIFDYERNIG